VTATLPAWELLDGGDGYIPTYAELSWSTTTGVRYMPYIEHPPRFQNGAVRYRMELRDLTGMTMYNAPSILVNQSQPLWDFTANSLNVFGTVMIQRVPETYDATADGQDFATRGSYMVVGTGTPEDSQTGEEEDVLVLYGPLTIRFMQAPTHGRMEFVGSHGGSCGCGCGGSGSYWAPAGGSGDGSGGGTEPPEPYPLPEDAVLVYGDQHIDGQKDFSVMPTVHGIPIDAAASEWFTGSGPPGEPFPGADVHDYYLDTSNGDVYRLADQIPVLNMTPGTTSTSTSTEEDTSGEV